MHIVKNTFASIIGFIAIIGCSGPSILNNIFVPSSGYTVKKDIEYGTGLRQKLDIYLPDAIDKPAPVIVFYYGGSWQSGNKKDYLFVGQAFASKGYIAVIADYRLYPDVYYPEFLQDGAKAYAWVHRNIDSFGGDPERIYISGHSAGAYIAMMLTLNDRYLKAAGASREWIRGAIGLAGPYDFLPFTDPNIKAIFSKYSAESTQPINYVASNMPPILLLSGNADTEVALKNTANLTAKLRSYGNSVETKIYHDVGHIGIVLSLANGFRGKASTLDDIDRFIKTTDILSK